MAKEFYSSTLNGVELKCKFAFPKIYFTKDFADYEESVYYDIGILVDIGWQKSNSATPQYSLNMIKPMDITAGMSMAQGELTFKTFHHDSLSLLKAEVLKGINGGKDRIEFPLIEDNPFVTLEDATADLVFDTHSDPDKINWSQMPLFDIVLISQASAEFTEKKLKIKKIRGVKITSMGFAESIESLEMNSMASFMAIGEITDWEDVEHE
ncbi:MAG: hypothetical protein ACRCX2_28780 [Paraclostridium sp.]